MIYYLIGLSMGGYGIYSLLSKYKGIFTKAIPICGGGDWTKAKALIDIPLWIFHCELDPIVDVEESRNMANAIVKAGGCPKYTEFLKKDHNAWDDAYKSIETFNWLFGIPSTKPIIEPLINAGPKVFNFFVHFDAGFGKAIYFVWNQDWNKGIKMIQEEKDLWSLIGKFPELIEYKLVIWDLVEGKEIDLKKNPGTCEKGVIHMNTFTGYEFYIHIYPHF